MPGRGPPAGGSRLVPRSLLRNSPSRVPPYRRRQRARALAGRNSRDHTPPCDVNPNPINADTESRAPACPRMRSLPLSWFDAHLRSYAEHYGPGLARSAPSTCLSRVALPISRWPRIAMPISRKPFGTVDGASAIRSSGRQDLVRLELQVVAQPARDGRIVFDNEKAAHSWIA